MKAIIEIRSGEGGKDSKLFIVDMMKMYVKYCEKKKISFDVLHMNDSEITIEVEGNIDNLVKYEPGVHRVQRVPPTESKGRRQSSTITVAVLPLSKNLFDLNMSEVRIETFRGQGPGGQHRNTSDTGIKAIHEPTKTIAVCSKGRSQHRNKQIALDLLRARLEKVSIENSNNQKQGARKNQIGCSGRAEKIRTYNLIENRVKDVRLKKAIYCADKVMQGNLDKIYDKIA